MTEKMPTQPPAPQPLFEMIEGKPSMNIDAFEQAVREKNAERLAEAKTFLRDHGIDDQRFDRIIAVRNLRNMIVDQLRQDYQKRKTQNPVPTLEEYSAGVFAEGIEPQLRDAVFALRRKGYATSSSGFGSWDYQQIVFSDTDLTVLPPETLSELQSLGVEVKKTSLAFVMTSRDLNETKNMWDRIADILPDLGHPAADTAHSAATTFREKYPLKKT